MATSLRIQTPSMIKESARQHGCTRMGYTDTNQGLYTEHLLHKNQQKDGKQVVNRYVWLGDKYRDPDRMIPTNFGPPPAGKPKWKAMNNEWYPGSRNECNTFGLNGQRIKSNRDGDPFPEAGAKGVRKDREVTKVGFGANQGPTKFVPEMSTAHQQARFLYAISQEQKLGAAKGREPSEDEIQAFLARSAEIQAETSFDTTHGPGNPREAWGEPTTRTLRDGRTVRIRAGETAAFTEDDNPYLEFLPRHMQANLVEKRSDRCGLQERNHEFGNAQAAQTRQERQRKSRLPRTYGSARPTSATIGEGVWATTAAMSKTSNVSGERHAKASATKKFVDPAHLGTNLPDSAGKARFTIGKSSQLYRNTQAKYN